MPGHDTNQHSNVEAITILHNLLTAAGISASYCGSLFSPFSNLAISGSRVSGVSTAKCDLDFIKALISFTPASANGLPILNVKSLLEILSLTSPATTNLLLMIGLVGFLQACINRDIAMVSLLAYICIFPAVLAASGKSFSNAANFEGGDAS